MKQTIINLLFYLLTINLGIAQENLLGKISRQEILESEHQEWFNSGYENYEVKPVEVNTDQIDITVFFGSWCGDSRNFVPKFLKVFDSQGFREEQLTLIAVDNQLDTYKQSPDMEQKGLDIYRVPTFLIYKNGKLINRIIERPRQTLEEDLVNIIEGKSYIPHYQFSLELDQSIDSYTRKNLRKLDPESVKPLLESQSELLSYALSKLAAEDPEKAIKALLINEKIYPNYLRNYQFLEIAYQASGNKKKAEQVKEKYEAIQAKGN